MAVGVMFLAIVVVAQGRACFSSLETSVNTNALCLGDTQCLLALL